MPAASTGNVIAAVCSFFIPGLGQLVQGRLGAALFFFVMAVLLWGIGIVTFGLLAVISVIANLWACIDAATYKGARTAGSY